MKIQNIRNFSIIAHIDHGKSTLADALLTFTKSISDRDKKSQFLDNMDLERERGITIKAQTVCLKYKSSQTGKEYQFNLIDTPGHVDFSYEVSRSLAACEGALLVVDAAQGVEAQTLANVYQAIDNNLELIPILNKIDLPAANPDDVIFQIENTIGIDATDAIFASAKNNTGIEDILEAIVTKVPAPNGNKQKPLKALVFDSWFDSYQGVVILCRIFDGSLKVGDKIRFMASSVDYEVLKLGVNAPFPVERKMLSVGEVGFVICGIKNIRDVRVGETITLAKNPTFKPLAGFKSVKPMIFSGIFPIDSTQYQKLRDSLEKLCLNDSSLSFEPENSAALGLGFRCGFLGLLHLEIVQERLEREFNLELITTAPSVVYHIYKTNDEMMHLEKPSDLPDRSQIDRIEEPFLKVTIHTPSDYLGGILKLCEERRGIQEKLEFVTQGKVIVEYKLPMNEMVLDFYDKLKSISKGYASMDYEVVGFEASDLVRLDILLNGDPVDALSLIVHKSNSYSRGRALTKKMKDLIPRQQFQVAIQAAIGSKIIARETISAMRKDVTAKCYGGDITRKRKLLEKQKAGKKRMKQIGSVEVPQSAFLAILKIDS